MATRCDLNGVLDRLATILAAANTTTASPIDLSANMSRRVQKVLKVHPEMIEPQASHYPFVTCYVEEKTINHQQGTIAKDQLTAKRAANVMVTIVGGVFNQNMRDLTEDPASEEIYYLMENVEYVLRTDPTLNGLVDWQRPNSIQYYSGVFNNQTHLRAGVLSLQLSNLKY